MLKATIADLPFKGIDPYSVGWRERNDLYKKVSYKNLAGVYLDTGDPDKVREYAMKLSEEYDRPVGVAYDPSHDSGLLLAFTLPRTPATCWTKTFEFVAFKGRQLSPKDLLDSCYQIHKFVDNGCVECPDLEGCVSKLVPEAWNITANAAGISSEYFDGGDSDESTEDATALIKSSSFLDYISPIYTTDEPFPKSLRRSNEISLSEETLADTRELIQIRNRKAAKSREFGKKNCSQCVLNTRGNCAPPVYGKPEYWRRPMCDGPVSIEDVRSYLIKDLTENTSWKGIPSWNNRILLAAISLVGSVYKIPTMGKRGQSGRVVNLVPSDDSEKLEDSIVLARRTWGAEEFSRCTLGQLVSANPERLSLDFKKSPHRKALSKDQRIAVAWFLSRARPQESISFQGTQTRWPSSFDFRDHATGTGRPLVDISLCRSWHDVTITTLADLHRPWQYVDLFNGIKGIDRWSRRSQNW